ncbi:hypothetical protein PISMIDRAFT_681526 [Pisolithus microcarpus 441]|uniref:Uncharacterized protein n=1 Tax=Pisolithus microcarpus 441 TaxID=765257 RepID=A0A0C9YWW6_9AGAM|nr:hypothetical protein PISMIDRAFT_681526 [Pisolithus microcarpus 441]
MTIPFAHVRIASSAIPSPSSKSMPPFVPGPGNSDLRHRFVPELSTVRPDSRLVTFCNTSMMTPFVRIRTTRSKPCTRHGTVPVMADPRVSESSLRLTLVKANYVFLSTMFSWKDKCQFCRFVGTESG